MRGDVSNAHLGLAERVVREWVTWCQTREGYECSAATRQAELARRIAAALDQLADALH